MSWNLIVDDTFANPGGTTSQGGAGSTTGVPTVPTVGASNGWTDHAGSNWSLASGKLLGTNTGSGSYQTNHLIRTGGEVGNPDLRWLLDTTAPNTNSAGDHYAAAFRFVDINNYYLFDIDTAGGHFVAYKIVGGAGAAQIGGLGTVTIASFSHPLEIECIAQDASPTTLTCNITDTVTSTLIGTLTVTDSESVLQASGLAATIDGYNTPASYTRVRLFDRAAASPPSLGIVAVTSATTAAVNLAPASASGATSYQWYRSTTSGFSPGSGNLLSGATSSSLADATAAAGTDYFYVLVATNINGSTASNQAYGRRLDATLNFSAIGESTYNGQNADNTGGDQPANSIPVLMGQAISVSGSLLAVAVQNSAADGQPTDHFYTTSAQGPLTTAVAAAVANGSTYCHLMFGINDACNAANSAATYRAHVAGICATYQASGIKMVLHDAYLPPSDGVASGVTAAALVLMEQYGAQLDSLADGVNIFRGDKIAARLPALSVATYLSDDHEHLSVLGNRLLAAAQARAFDKILNPSGGGGGLFTNSLSGGLT